MGYMLGTNCSPCCKKQFPFLAIVFIDESSQYENGQSSFALTYWNKDLQFLRKVEQGTGTPFTVNNTFGSFTVPKDGIGQISIILVRPNLPAYYEQYKYGTLKPDSVAFPEEVVVFLKDYQRYKTIENKDIFYTITEFIRQNNFGCIGIMVDSSGSTTFEEISPGLNWWYDRISGKVEDDKIKPLPSCNGTLNLGKANGCVEERIFYDEDWLAKATDSALSLFTKGCKEKIEET